MTIQARVGRRDAAIAQLEAGLPTSPSVSRWWLRLDPWWDGVRDDPRFARLAGR